MPATVTLSGTLLDQPVDASSSRIKLQRTNSVGAFPGIYLFVDRELMKLVSFAPSGGGWCNVLRGVSGTSGAPHDSGAAVFVGRGDQFYSTDPVGAPPEAIPVSPYINVINGTIWFAQGDSEPTGRTYRWWQPLTIGIKPGALGFLTADVNPTSST